MKNNRDPKVSVIIPLYNQRQFVEEAIESVLNQAYGNIEIIVVNDGSTDNPLHALEKYSNQTIVISQENRGLASARNTGIRRSSGEFLQFLDADDCLYPDKIELQLEFSTEMQADASYCELDLYLDASQEIIQREVGRVDDLFFHFFNLWNPYPTPIHSLLFKRDIFDRFGFFPEDLEADEDRFLLSVFAARGVSFEYFPLRGGLYRVHADSMNSDRLRMIESKIRFYEKINRELGESFILEKTGFRGGQMMEANLTYVYLSAVSEGCPRRFLRQIKKCYKENGIRFDAEPIPSRFRRSIFIRKLLAAYSRRWSGSRQTRGH